MVKRKRDAGVARPVDEVTETQRRMVWADDIMTAATRRALSEVIERRVRRWALLRMQVDRALVKVLVSCSSLSDTMRKLRQTASQADVVWSWIAQQQRRGDLRVDPHLERTTTAGHARPRWEFYAELFSGWHREETATEIGARELQDADRVMAELVRAQEHMSWRRWTDGGMVLRLERGTLTKVSRCGAA